MKIEGQRFYQTDAVDTRAAGKARGTAPGGSADGPNGKPPTGEARISDASQRLGEARAERLDRLRDRYVEGNMAPQPAVIARHMLAADER